MFYLHGELECLRTLLLVTAKNDAVARGEAQLKDYYLDFVTAIGGPEMRPATPAERITYDETRIAKLMAKHTDNQAPNDLIVGAIDTPLSARQEAMARVEAAIEHIGAVNPGLRRVFDLVIHTLFFHRSRNSGGGSVSSAPGAIWCSPRRQWSVTDTAEFLVHEFTHNMLFLDERRFEHYVDPQVLQQPENFAVSAVLKIPRPLDRAFHSLVVASEVLSFRDENGEPDAPQVHPGAAELVQACQETSDGIRAVISRKALVTRRFMAILERVEAKNRGYLAALPASLVPRPISNQAAASFAGGL
jgi:HEXXH motif-containing protein